MLHELLDRWRPQGGDPAEPVGLEIFADASCGDHASVADHHDFLQAEALSQPLDLARKGGGIGGVATEDLDGERPPLRVREQAEDDLQPIGPKVEGFKRLLAGRC